MEHLSRIPELNKVLCGLRSAAAFRRHFSGFFLHIFSMLSMLRNLAAMLELYFMTAVTSMDRAIRTRITGLLTIAAVSTDKV